jgi:hypothetical protein
LSPRSGRGLDAECPRHRPASRPWPCPVRDRVQSVTISWPCPHPRPQAVHVRVGVRPANVRTKPVSMNNPCPRPVRNRAQSMTVSSPCSWTVRDRVESATCPGHGCIASALRTIHFQTLSAHVRI